MVHFLQNDNGIKKIVPSVDGIKDGLRAHENRITGHFDRFVDSVVMYTPNVISAIIVLIVGMWIIKRVGKIAEKGMLRKDLEVSLRTFLKSLLSIGLKIVLIVTVAGMLGIGTTSFVTILGAAGLAVGLALQGSLSNFAGGVLILIFKPFKVGDAVEAGGQTGEVIEIQIFNTILLTADHKTVILPNGPLSNGTIVNSSRHGNVRIDIVLNVNNENNLEHVRQVILRTLNQNEKALKVPAPMISFGKVTEGSVIINVRPFCLPADSGDLVSELYREFKAVFEENGIKPGIQLKKDA